MSRKLFLITSLLILLAIFASACQSTEATEAPAEGAAAPSGYGALVNTIKERGKVVCGGRTDLAGFGELDADGRNIGFDIDLCRAIAAALLER